MSKDNLNNSPFNDENDHSRDDEENHSLNNGENNNLNEAPGNDPFNISDWSFFGDSNEDLKPNKRSKEEVNEFEEDEKRPSKKPKEGTDDNLYLPPDFLKQAFASLVPVGKGENDFSENHFSGADVFYDNYNKVKDNFSEAVKFFLNLHNPSSSSSSSSSKFSNSYSSSSSKSFAIEEENNFWFTDIDINSMLTSLKQSAGLNYLISNAASQVPIHAKVVIAQAIQQLKEHHTTVVIPINLGYIEDSTYIPNHWVGLVIEKKGETLSASYMDSLDNTMDGSFEELREILKTFNIIDITQPKVYAQQNGYDCGPLTALNLHNFVQGALCLQPAPLQEKIENYRKIIYPLHKANENFVQSAENAMNKEHGKVQTSSSSSSAYEDNDDLVRALKLSREDQKTKKQTSSTLTDNDSNLKEAIRLSLEQHSQFDDNDDLALAIALSLDPSTVDNNNFILNLQGDNSE